MKQPLGFWEIWKGFITLCSVLRAETSISVELMTRWWKILAIFWLLHQGKRLPLPKSIPSAILYLHYLHYSACYLFSLPIVLVGKGSTGHSAVAPEHNCTGGSLYWRANYTTVKNLNAHFLVSWKVSLSAEGQLTQRGNRILHVHIPLQKELLHKLCLWQNLLRSDYYASSHKRRKNVSVDTKSVLIKWNTSPINNGLKETVLLPAPHASVFWRLLR